MRLYRTLVFMLGGVGLLLVIAPSLLVFASVIPLETSQTLMFLGTLMWFAAAALKPKGK